MWKLNIIFPNSQWVKEEIKGKLKKEKKKNLEINKNVDKMYQNLWETVKVILRGNFAMINTYIKKKERAQIAKLALYIKELGKKENKLWPKKAERRK